MKIYLGADHGGFELKNQIKKWLDERGDEVVDFGAVNLDRDDDFVEPAVAVVGALQEDQEARGILFCRNGFGMSIVANRFDGIRCGLAFDPQAVEKGRNDDDINCLAVPSDYLSSSQVETMVKNFLETDFSKEERYVRRIDQIDNLFGDCEDGFCCGGNCGCQHDK